MAVKQDKKSKSGRRRLYEAVKGGPFRLRKRPPTGALTPPDNGAAAHPAGVLRFDSDKFHLPEALAEAGENESNSAIPERVVWVITILMVIFISIMTWFVSRMPAK
jgi:hypothetical protein